MDTPEKTGFFAFLRTAVGALFSLIWNLIRGTLRLFIGSTQWTPPTWLQWIGRGLRRYAAFLSRHRRIAALHVLLPVAAAAAGYGAWLWYEAQPKPVYTHISLSAPAPTEWIEGEPRYNSLWLSFSQSVATLEAVNQPVSTGISLTPAIPGQWFWRNDRRLEFVPSGDWQIGQEYRVRITPEALLADHIRLADQSKTFTTRPFTASRGAVEFYQDPVDPAMKKVVATVTFSHPVDPVSFERNIRIKPETGLEFLHPGQPPFSVVYSRDGRTAHIHSAPVAVPRLDRSLQVTLTSGTAPKAGGNRLDSDLNWHQSIPGRGKLRLQSPQIMIVEQGNTPEQVLSLRTNAPVLETDMSNQLQVWLLPEQPASPEQRRSFQGWHNNNIGPDDLARSTRVQPLYIAGEYESSQQHHLKLNVPPGRYLLVQMEAGLQAVGGYELAERFSQVIQVPAYPTLLKFMAEGNVLSLRGDQKLAVLSRGVEHLQYEVQHIQPDQLHHYLSDNYRDVSTNHVDEDDLNKVITRYQAQMRTSSADRRETAVTALDLGQLLNRNGIRSGLFIVSMAAGREAPGYYSNNPDTRRLVMLTDIGLLVKHSREGASDLYAVSVSNGQPLANARADLIASNGQVLQSVQTDAQGHARFRPVQMYARERSPLAYVVRHGQDSAFIPFRSGARTLDYSRFDVGGDSDLNSNELSAHAFSDRNLYRPGEAARLMFVVRSGDWRPSYDGMPIQLEIHDPRGISVLRERRRLHRSGFDALEFSLPGTALTGDYRFRVSRVVNGQYEEIRELGVTHFSVREFEPDRLKVATRLSDKPVRGWMKPADLQAQVNVQHLFGTPAVGARVTAAMTLAPAYPHFSAFSDYRFTDPGAGNERRYDVSEDLGEQETDAEGNARFNPDLARFDRATYLFSLHSTAYEKGSGRGVNTSISQLVSEADYMVGYKADGDLTIRHNSERQVHFVAINQQLQATALDAVQLQLAERRHVSVLAQQSNGTYRYVSREREYALSSDTIRFTGDGYTLPLDSRTPGNYVLRLRNAEGQLIASLNYRVTGTANLTRSLERNAELSVTLDKREYRNGDSIEVSIIAPYTGTGLITIERDQVYASHWFTTHTTSSVQRIVLPEGLEGNAYVNVQFIRAADSEEVYMSPLSVGVVPFNINRQARVLPAGLSSLPRIRPGDRLPLTLTTEDSSRAVLVAVDEGILQVAGFSTPDPLGHFLRKRRLQVETLQMLDLILPDFSQLMAAAPGGDAPADALAQNLNPFKKKRQPPVVWWSGVQDLSPGEHRFEFEVPDYFNGRVRLYAVLANERKLQVLESHALVQGDLILAPSVPPAVSPHDEVNLAVSLYNNIAGSGSADIQVELELPGGGTVLNGASRQVSVAEGRDQLLEFRVRLGDSPGEQPVIFSARSGDYQARYRESISVRPASPYRTVLQAGMIAPGSSHNAEGLRQLHTEYAQSAVSVGASPLPWAKGLTGYLNHYAHQCTEQLTSRAVPWLVLQGYADLANPDGLSLADVLRTLRSRQNDEGGFGLWLASPNASDYATLFALHFLLEARDRREAVPDDVLGQALSYTERLVRRPHQNLSDLRLAAWGVYLIARSGRTPGNLLTAVEADLQKYFPHQWRQDLAAAYLASARALQQQPELALPLMKNLTWGKESQRVVLYQDDLTRQAIQLYLLSKHFPELLTGVPDSVLLNMGQAISRQQYHSQSAAWMILALESYHSRAAATGAQAQVSYLTTAQSPAQTLPLSRGGAAQSADIPATATALTLRNDASLPLFYAISQSGFDREAAPASRNGLEIQRDYVGLDGKALSAIRVGDEFLVRLRLRALQGGRYEQLALVDLLPGGIEPVPVIRPAGAVDEYEDDSGYRSGVLTSSSGPWSLDYDNLRDDRLLLYGNLYDDGVAELTYRVRAVNAGRFSVPVAYVQAMYEPDVFAITSPGELVIEAP